MVSRNRVFSVLGLAFIIALALIAIYTRGLLVGDASAIWSAFGTVSAVVVALVIALHSSWQAGAKDNKRAAAAAILVSTNLYQLRAAVDVISENSDLVRGNREGYAPWLATASANLVNMGPVIEDKYLPVLVELPTDALFGLVVANNWLAQFQKRCAFRDGVRLDEVIARFDCTINEIIEGRKVVVAASNRMHTLSGIHGAAPWDREIPSWTRPRL